MRKFIVRFDREGCIGAGACTAVQPDKWVMNYDDMKVDFIGSQKSGVFFELEITEEGFETFKKSADVCPVGVIMIFDENGKKVFPITKT